MNKLKRTTIDELQDATGREVREIKLYCILLVNPDSGTYRIFSTVDMDECINASLEFRQSDLYVDTFTKTLLMMPGHKLYELGTPIRKRNGTYLVKPL